MSSYKICHLYLAMISSPLSCATGHGWWWCSTLLELLPFSGACLTVSKADLLRSPLLAVRLILHATGISSIDHGCRSVCRCLHRSVTLITHSHSSARLLISPRPLSLLLCLTLSLTYTLPQSLSRPLAFSFHPRALTFLTHIFLIRQKKKKIKDGIWIFIRKPH